ncbi:MAG: hypothetical protein ACFFCS_06645 [Candidatus Hodarchaeota archaeon]
MPIEWFDPASFDGCNDKWLEKFKSGDYKGDSRDDIELWLRGMAEFGLKAIDDDDLEYNEVIEDSLLQYESVAIFTEVRDTDLKFVQYFTEEEQKIGKYSGNWKDALGELNVKNHVQMEMIPDIHCLS